MFELSPKFHSANIRILTHHIYEYKKGLRPLALHTLSSQERSIAERILQRREVAYFIQEVSTQKINIFLGDTNCIEVIKSFRKDSLSDYTPEQDFILGTMLGYSRQEQVNRYLKFTSKKELQNL
ncbi:MAG: DUF2023 family protein [Flavobacteriaceae bacterium]|nr:DUF2023 family protein [Flavobacteriaceae bacterium]